MTSGEGGSRAKAIQKVKNIELNLLKPTDGFHIKNFVVVDKSKPI